MRKGTVGVRAILCIAVTLTCVQTLWASGPVQSAASLRVGDPATAGQLSLLQDVQKYNRSIHIMAMLLVGFGFLMVFVKKYGRSAVTATYLLVSVAIPAYFLVNGLGVFGKPEAAEIDRLILAEFAAASLLICAGAVLGRLKMGQYMVLGVLFIVCYMLNEWVVLKGGLGLVAGGFADTGGSIVIHAFGALFGLGVILTMTTQSEFSEKIECDVTGDRFSMLGSMVLWIFWPSFCAALVAPEMVPFTAINVVLALYGATLTTYLASVLLRGGKINIGDIANASLAGGVAIGSTVRSRESPDGVPHRPDGQRGLDVRLCRRPGQTPGQAQERRYVRRAEPARLAGPDGRTGGALRRQRARQDNADQGHRHNGRDRPGRRLPDGQGPVPLRPKGQSLRGRRRICRRRGLTGRSRNRVRSRSRRIACYVTCCYAVTYDHYEMMIGPRRDGTRTGRNNVRRER
jgi:hypothetical protein